MHTVMHGAPALPYPSAASPDDDRTLYMQGLLALRNNDGDSAACLLTRALRRQPSHSGMRRNLVRALLLTQRFEQVVIQARAALAAEPDDSELHFALGTALNAVGQPSRACAAFARALSLQPDHAPSWLNMGNASADMDDLASAESLYRTAIRLDPLLPEAHASLGHVLAMRGQIPSAIEACETAIQLLPAFAQAHWNLAIAALLGGDLRRGFTEYEWRKRHARYRADFPDLPGEAWDGTRAEGRTILVRAEQGFGDCIQFARYLPLIQAMGGRAILVCTAPLVPLMRSIPGLTVVGSLEPLPAYDAWIDQISLARIFGTKLDNIPAAAFYLTADPVRVEAWRSRLPAGRKIGIALSGNPMHPGDRRRSIPADVAIKLPHGLGLSFVSLQHGASPSCLGLPDLTAWMPDYAETAALIENLDLVVTVDTSVAHLAGALGKPVWIMLPHAPDWRWMLGRLDSPWYASVRLFRQSVAGDWHGVLAEVMGELERVRGV